MIAATTHRAPLSFALCLALVGAAGCGGGGTGTTATETDATDSDATETDDESTTEGSTEPTTFGTSVTSDTDASTDPTTETTVDPSETETTSDSDADSDTDTETEATSDTDTTPVDPVEIAGLYVDGFGADHDISNDAWVISFEGSEPSTFHVAWYDNEIDRLVAQNDAANEFNPSLWSLFEWTFTDGGTSLWYCQTVFDAATQSDAEDAPAADKSDPKGGGCGGFPWSPLEPL